MKATGPQFMIRHKTVFFATEHSHVTFHLHQLSDFLITSLRCSV